MLPAWGRAGNHPCAKERKAVQHAKAHQQAQREVLIETKHQNMPPAGLQCVMLRSFMLCAAQSKRQIYYFARVQKTGKDIPGEGPGPKSYLFCSDRHPVRVGVRTKCIFSAKKACFSLCSLYFQVSKADGCETSVCSSALAAAP